MGKTHHGSPPVTAAEAVVAEGERTAARSLEHDIETVRRVVRNRLGDRVSALVLAGSFGRGEGCFWSHQGSVVPGNNLNIVLVSPQPLQQADLESIRQEILAESYVESVVLTPFVEADLPTLPPTVETIDLTESVKLIDGDATKVESLPSFEDVDVPLWEAEKVLRSRLVTLIEAFPRGTDTVRSFYRASKSVFASVDALLIRNKLYRPSYHEKVRRFQKLIEDPHLLRLVNAALEVKISGRTPSDYTAESFWALALRFHLDSLLGLFQSRGSSREERLSELLAGFHYLATSPGRTLRNISRTVLYRNARGNVERLLLALAIARDTGAVTAQRPGGPDFSSIGRRAGVAPFAGWVEGAEAALDRWYSLSAL